MLGLVWGLHADQPLAITNTLIQLVVPDELRGRVLSTYTWALGGFWPLGSLLTGWLAERMGAGAAVLVLAGLSALIALVGWAVYPEARRMS
jgi:cyanate permease